MAFARKDTVTVTGNSALLPSTQTDFPVLYSVTNNDLRTVGNGGYVQNSSGYDIRFFSDPGLTAALPFYLQRYNATTGEAIFRIKISSLSLSSQFYVGFGDAALNTDASSTSTWNSGFVTVFQMPDGTTLSLADATSNGINGTNNGSIVAAAGFVDGGASLVAASSQYIGLGNPGAYAFTAFTFNCYLKATTFPADAAVFCKRNDIAGEYLIINVRNDAGVGTLTEFITCTGGNANRDATATMNTGTWYMVTVSYDSTNGLALYIDGTSAGTLSAVGNMVPVTTSDANISLNTVVTPRYLNGLIDEVQISNVWRSADWTKTERSTTNDPANFLSHSFEAAGGGQIVGGGAIIKGSIIRGGRIIGC